MPARTQTNGASTPTAAAGRRRSTRISSTGKTSRYFDEDDVDDDDQDAPPPRSAKAKKRAAAAALEDSDEVDGAQFSDGSEDVDEEADSADDGAEAPPPSRKRGRGRPAKATPNKKAKATKAMGADDAKAPPPRKRGRPAKATPKPAAKKQPQAAKEEEEEEEDDDDDEEESRFTFEPIPQLRDTGGIAYEDTKLHPNTLAFLEDLKANNKRSWLKARDPEYRRSLKDWETFVESLTEKIIDADETVPELPLKDVIFRIYRDIRFSKDPTPYKPHYSAAWSRTGRKGPYACYYVHCEPGRSFVGGGLWHPDRAALARLRASIDARPRRLRRVLLAPGFRAAFLPRARARAGDNDDDDDDDDEAAVLAAFTAANRADALKTRPQGFPPDHPDIELLKLRNFTVSRPLRDADLTAPDAQDRIMEAVRAMVDYVTFLNRVVMPDPGEDSSSDEDDEANGSAGDEGDET